MKIALLGNITLDFFAQDFRRMGHETYVPPGFDTWRQETLDPGSGLHRFAPGTGGIGGKADLSGDCRVLRGSSDPRTGPG